MAGLQFRIGLTDAWHPWMPAIAAELARQLAKVDRPGDFCASGTTELLAPSLHVEGVGPVSGPSVRACGRAACAAAGLAP